MDGKAAHRRARSRADRGDRRPHREHAGAFPGLPRDRRPRPRRGTLRRASSAASASSTACGPSNPRPKLWRKFDTKGFGAGRNVRFGDLDGDGRLDMLFAQNVPKVRGDAFDQISCLTAVTLDGKVLWQQGRPNPKNGLLTNDTPFQIHDLDGDGRTEVVLARDFQLQVLDGRTGKLLRSAWLPQMSPEIKDRPVRAEQRRLAAVRRSERRRRAARDPRQGSLPRLLDLQQGPEAALGGPGADRSLSVPDRHERRRRPGVPDRLLALGADGKRRWTHDAALKDHADALSIGNFTGRARCGALRAYVDGSDEGFLVFDVADGKLLKHLRLGHAQTQSVGKYRPICRACRS